MLKFKNVAGAVSDYDAGSGVVILYASSFDVLDSDNDVMERGAFTKTIAERGPGGSNRIKQLWQHDPWTPIGRPLKMEEDQKGLRIESFVSDIKNGDYRKMYADGIITEHSIGFETMKETPGTGFNRLQEVRLWEYSAVTWGANSDTPVVGMKGLNKQEKADKLFDRFTRLQKFIRTSDATDETLQALELEIKQIEAVMHSLLKEPGKSHSEEGEPLKLTGDTLASMFNFKTDLKNG